MAQVARAFGNIQHSPASGHMPSGGRNVASADNSPIDGIGVSTGVQAEESFLFQDFEEGGSRRRREAPPVKNTAGKFEAPSSSFAHLIGQEQNDNERAESPQYGTAAFRNILSRAITAYETTAQTISGSVNPLGASLTLSL